MAVGFVVMFAILLTVTLLPNINITPNIWWYGFAGVLWGLRIIIPGMTSSSILMCLNIYESFNAGLSVLDMEVVIPWIIGMAITVILFARIVDKAFKKHYSVCYHGVIGIVLASTLIIVPIFEKYILSDILISIGCFAGGFFLAYISDSIKAE